ncbi:MAG TPA: MDR family MFS transporter, partial [Steroidobacteraceae bacterium]|nr:MDR family MFS transporter [Steroidobacteraceae bacterium]
MTSHSTAHSITHSITESEKRITIAAIMTVFLLSALDQTVVSTAMPRIIADLHGLEMYSWTATAYMLTSTIMVPIYGKLGDMYGRKIILTVGVTIFLLGSALCGLAGEFGDLPLVGDGMVQLIVCRAIQGLGSGALFSGAFAVIGDLYSPRERGKVMGYFVAVFSLSSVAGPTIGGFFTDHGTMELFGYTVAGWRWVFYVNLPLGLVALFLIMFKMHRTNAPTGGRVDYFGASFLIAAFVPLLLALTWAGNKYAWSSPEILGMLAISIAALVVFLVVESRVTDPIMPLPLMRTRAIAITNAAAFVINMAFFGVVMFMPLYMQLVLGVNATKSGFAMLPLMLGIMSTAMVSGRYVRKTGHYKPLMVASCVTLFIGVIFLAQINADTTINQLNWRLLLVGVGLGPAQSLYSIAVQNAAPLHQLGIATSSSQFFRQIGSTVGIAVFGTILTNNLAQELPKRIPQLPGAMTQKVDIGRMQALAMNPGVLRGVVQMGMKRSGGTADEAEITARTERLHHDIKEGFSVSIV